MGSPYDNPYGRLVAREIEASHVVCKYWFRLINSFNLL